ncbi:MAG: acyl-CoA thioesterase [Clostridia bacterium]
MEISFKYNFTPRFSDIDSYSIAHHSGFFYWFEEARYYFLQAILKVGIEDINKLRVPVTRLGCDYKKPVYFGEVYVIITKLIIPEDKPLLRFEYNIMNSTETIGFAQGFTEHVFVNNYGGLLFKIPDFILEKLEQLE